MAHRLRQQYTNKKNARSLTPEQMRSHTLHRSYVVVAISLVVLVAALIVSLVFLHITSQNVSQQQTSNGQAQQTETDIANSDATSTDTSSSDSNDESSTQTVKTSVPDITTLMGLNRSDALQQIGHGAALVSATDVNESDNPVVKKLTVVLTHEPGDSKQGTPTVYLGLDSNETVIQAGYSSPTSLLGFGRLSFVDAITNEHIIEQTLKKAGLTVSQGDITLPSSKKDYSIYGSDGHTLVQEKASFQGEGFSNKGVTYSWTSTLQYDYSRANATGNLANTTREIYVYINAQ